MSVLKPISQTVKPLLCLFLLLFCLDPGPCLRAEYPEQPIKVIVPTNTGGEVDTMARIFQQAFQEHELLPAKLAVINLPGAGGTLGSRRIKESAPDGYTIGICTPGIVTSKAMGIVDFDHNDFEIIGGTGHSSLGLGVLESSKFPSIESLISQAKESPGSIKVATNIGLPVHLVPMMFAEEVGIEFRFIQSGGGSKRLASILGKHTDLSMFSLLELIRYKDSGIRPLVFLSEERVQPFPETPTARELGADVVTRDTKVWIAPKGTPPDRVRRIAKALRQAMSHPEVAERFANLGIRSHFAEEAEMRSFLEDMRKKVTPIVAKARNR
jgi:tripartite-type tricarboxylate transporter receptor subunit TctC